jgi:hypothetical protein
LSYHRPVYGRGAGQSRTNDLSAIGANLVNFKNVAALALAAMIASPAFAAGYDSPEPPAAAPTQPAGLTRAQVRAELVQLEQAGYRPYTGHASYPDQIEAAEAKVAAQNGGTGVGGVADGSSNAGHLAISKFDWNEMYGRH